MEKIFNRTDNVKVLTHGKIGSLSLSRREYSMQMRIYRSNKWNV